MTRFLPSVDAIICSSRAILTKRQMDEIKDISTQDIQDKWLRGMMEECDARDLVYHSKQKTTKLFGTHTFLEIPELNAIVAASTVPGVQLYLNPNEDPWEMQEFQACARSPRDFAEMVIHIRMKQLGK